MIEIKGFRGGGGGRRRGDFKVKTNNSPGSENGINFRGRRDYWETRFIFIPHFISVLRKNPEMQLLLIFIIRMLQLCRAL